MSTNHLKRQRALAAAYGLWPQASDACSYCGVRADTYDHVPPLSLVHALGLDHFHEQKIDLWLVPACKECNCLLVQYPGTSATSRTLRIKVLLRRRYAKVLKSPDWTEEEMEPLGRGLQDVIRAGMALKIYTKRRLAW